MEINITYRHLNSSKPLEEKIQKKATKLKKFFQGKFIVDWICSVEGSNHSSDVTISGDHFNFHATSTSSDNLYKTLDEVVPKLEKQIIKHKEQTRNVIHKNS